MEPGTSEAGSATVTIAIITHNGRDVIEDCLRGVAKQSRPATKVLVIDVASEDGTAELAAEQLPEADIVRLDSNLGPNPARNLALRLATTRHVMLVDDDAVPTSDCLGELLATAERHPDGGVFVPRAVYHDDPGTVQHQGGKFHFVGDAMLYDADVPATEASTSIRRITIGTGICMFVAKHAWEAVGGFDDDYFFGRTDSEFTHRVALAGFAIYAVPSAVCRHKVKTRGFDKLFYQIRNRWYFTLTAYSARTLVILAPAMLVHEICLAFFLLCKRQLGSHLLALAGVVKSLPMIRKKRAAIQALRRVPDRLLLDTGPIMVRSDVMGGRCQSVVKAALESFYRSYWRLARDLLDGSRAPRRPVRQSTRGAER